MILNIVVKKNMPVGSEILYIIFSFFNITLCNDVTFIKKIFDIELPECLLATYVNDINKYHPFWRYWILRSHICHKTCTVNSVQHSINDVPLIMLDAQHWYRNGVLHRDNDLPAIINKHVSKAWCKNGVFHRDNDLPALVFDNGSCEWYKNGKIHRDNDLPAIVYSTKKEWYKNGLLHRDNDLPARTYCTGKMEWYKNGILYRDNVYRQV